MMLRKYGTQTDIYFVLVKRAVVDFAVSADYTFSAGDFKISKDGGAAANPTNSPSFITMGNTALLKLTLTSTEMQAAQVVVTMSDSATKAIEDNSVVIETYGHASALHPFDLGTASTAQTGDSYAIVNHGTNGNAAIKTQVAAIEVDTQDIQSRIPAALVNNRMDCTIDGTGMEAGAVTAVQSGLATSAEVTGLNINTRCNLLVPQQIETPDSSTQVYKIRLHLFDPVGNMEAPDSTPTVALTNAAGTDRSSRLSSASNPSTGVYTWDYTATAGDAEEQLVWLFTVVEGGATRTYPANSYVVEYTSYRFNSSDRTNLNNLVSRLGTPTDLGNGATIADNLVTIESQTDGIGDIASKSDVIDVNVVSVDGDDDAATNIKLFYNGTGYYAVNSIIETVGNMDPDGIGEILATAIAGFDPGTLAYVIESINAKTANLPAAPAATGDIPTAAAITAAVFAQVIETGTTFLQAQRAQFAFAVGAVTGAGTGTEVIKGGGVATTRMTYTVDEVGNRTVVLNL